MKKYLFVTGLLVAGLFNVYSCGGSSGGGDDGGGEAASTANTGAAVASVFGMGSDESVSAELLHAIARQVGDDEEQMEDGDGGDGPEGAGERNTCDDPDGNEEADGPEEVETPLTGESGTYGNVAGGDIVTVDQDDFCVGDDGVANEGDDLFASFTLRQTVTGTCTDDTTISMTAGTGIWRNTDDCFPEIYGSFTMNINDCDVHICMGEDQTVGSDSSVSCGGQVVSVNTEVECTLSASESEDDEEDTGDDEETGEGFECDADADCAEIAEGGECIEGFCVLACSTDTDCDVLDQALGMNFSCEDGFCEE